jgi:hypothetical protein
MRWFYGRRCQGVTYQSFFHRSTAASNRRSAIKKGTFQTPFNRYVKAQSQCSSVPKNSVIVLGSALELVLVLAL